MTDDEVTRGIRVALRRIRDEDLQTIATHEYSVSVTEPHSEVARLRELLDTTQFWSHESTAAAIVSLASDQMVGTIHCYRSAPCIHGLELGYVSHDANDYGKGYASEATRLFSDHLFGRDEAFFRQQLIIEVWNTASSKVAERAGFVREGILRSAGFGEDDPADAYIYSRTRKDFGQELASANGST